MKKIIFILVFALVLFSCATSGSVISDSADLSKYNYATISNVMDYGGSPILMDID